MRFLLSVLFLFIGTAMMGFGVGTWVHPGAGIAVVGAVIVSVAVLIGYQV